MLCGGGFLIWGGVPIFQIIFGVGGPKIWGNSSFFLGGGGHQFGWGIPSLRGVDLGGGSLILSGGGGHNKGFYMVEMEAELRGGGLILGLILGSPLYFFWGGEGGGVLTWGSLCSGGVHEWK